DSLDQKLDNVIKRENKIDQRDTLIQRKESELVNKTLEIEKTLTDVRARLSEVASLTEEQAKEQLLEEVRHDTEHEATILTQRIIEEAESEARGRSREITLQAIQRYAAEHVADTTVRSIRITSDEMKGRIIGREGRNIRTFEHLTGVDVIVDDTPEAILLSGFDPVRREIARLSMEKLISDGRIHPTRIEDVVNKTIKEMDSIVLEAGEQACFDLGIHSVHNEIIKLLGKLHYRTSYGQNVLAHSKEVAMMCGLMANMLGLDPEIAKRCGLMHDIGKAIDRETEGTHTELGAEFVTRYNESPFVINSVASHHNDVPQESAYPVLVQAADAISGARPGARREPLENYIKRLQRLEEIADSFKGVSKAYAIQAGREIRVIVENSQVDDLGASILASDIAARVETEMQYPGQIKVTVIRESRSTEYAR
ncbi:MAG: ribonuclease Y, partial [candidate division Zixibacteria bacterium]|nr:ribonuclease Y [candidate division Zixibacteria bacterium]